MAGAAVAGAASRFTGMMGAQAAQLLEEAAVAYAACRWQDTIELCRRVLAFDSNNLYAHTIWAFASLPGENYIAVLDRIHRQVQPRTYVEIGIAQGDSFLLADPDTVAVGIDPQPALTRPLPASARVFAKTSDAFFAEHDLFAELGEQPVDLAFLDGMHLFPYALCDFINVERYSTSDTICLVHDCLPLDERTATSERTTSFWSGDVWKLILCLNKYRPDLEIHTIAAAPTGLAVIRGLDAESIVLSDRLEHIFNEFAAVPYSVLEHDRDTKLHVVANDWAAIKALL